MKHPPVIDDFGWFSHETLHLYGIFHWNRHETHETLWIFAIRRPKKNRKPVTGLVARWWAPQYQFQPEAAEGWVAFQSKNPMWNLEEFKVNKAGMLYQSESSDDCWMSTYSGGTSPIPENLAELRSRGRWISSPSWNCWSLQDHYSILKGWEETSDMTFNFSRKQVQISTSHVARLQNSG